MKIWIFTTKEPLEYLKLDEDDEIKRSSTDKAKKGDIILIYRGKPYSNIQYIFKAKNDAYQDKTFRDDWETAIDLYEKIELPNPLSFGEMKDDQVLGQFGVVRKNFMGSFFEVPSKECDRIKKLIINKNNDIEYAINRLFSDDRTEIEDTYQSKSNHWTFAINKGSYFEVKESEDDILWNSAKGVKMGDTIFVYTGAPYSSIEFIFTAKTDPFDHDRIRREYNTPAIYVHNKISIPNPVTFTEMKNDPILSQWVAIKMRMMGSHFKMTEKELIALYKLILKKNPDLQIDSEDMGLPIDFEDENEQIGFYKLNAGRAHIVRDICYLISKNNYHEPDTLYEDLREKIGDNTEYWKAYYQRSNKHTSPGYNLNSARNLELVEKNRLKLTELGQRLVNVTQKDEIFTHYFSIDVKKFFFELATKNHSILTAMRILKEKEELKFYSPVCERTNRVFWKKSMEGNRYLCTHDDYPECNNCDRDFKGHIKEPSLPFETLEQTNGKGYGFVFWMCSRVTPMHLTGTDPGYSGKTIYWDKDAEKELGDLIRLLDDGIEISDRIPRIWKIAPGDSEENVYLWPLFKNEGYTGIGWFGADEFIQKNYKEFDSDKEIKDVLVDGYGLSEQTSAPKMIWNFTNSIEIGDIIVANGGRKRVLGIGKVTSDYIPPQSPENPNFDEYFTHLRKVDWLITEEFDTEKDYFFDRKTVTELDGRKWNQIIGYYCQKNPEYKAAILEHIYKEFKTSYLDTDIGKDHLNAYNEESKRSQEIFLDIGLKINKGEDVTDNILYGLVPHRGKSIVGFVSDIKAFFEKSLEIDPQKFPDIANKLYQTIKGLVENDDDTEFQEKIIDEFVRSEYSKGFGTGYVSPTLFFINRKYPLINNKTIDTVSLLSDILDEPVKLNANLTDYIKNKQKIDKFMTDLSEYLPELSDFAIFDVFCHWMCDERLGFYAKGKPLPLLQIHTIIIDSEPVFIKPLDLQNATDLKINSKIFHEVCGTLNANKHIMLTGAPGTGKTNLGRDICRIAQKQKFTDGFILTTATSDWTTFDTIGGYMPDDKQNLVFVEGKFLQAINENKWLIIDEINRADIDKAFGQLFTVLSGQGVELPYKSDGSSVKIQPCDENRSYYDFETATYNVGKNWRILATMNVYDKDYLFEMSYAFMRRFTFINIGLPELDVFKELIDGWGDSLSKDHLDALKKLINIKDHRQIGPAIFKDMTSYLKERYKIGGHEHLVEDAVISYILPQFEGLEEQEIIPILKILQENLDIEEIKERMEFIVGCPIQLDRD